MSGYNWKTVAALGAVLAISGSVNAGDRDTMTLGGKGTVAQAATQDNEQTGGRYRGFYGWNGGYGWGGYSSFHRAHFRPSFGYSSFSFYQPTFFYSPRVFYPTYFAPPVFSSFYFTQPVFPSYYFPPRFGFYVGISGNANTAAPAVNLGTNFAQPAAQSDDRPVSGNATPGIAPATTPLKYKAYGEK